MTGRWPGYGRGIVRFGRDLGDVNRADIGLLLTVLIVLQIHLRYWYVSGPTIALCVAALIWPRWRTSSLLWAGILTLLSGAAVRHWYSIDNHQYLLIYWCLSLALALLLDSPDRERCLATSGSLLLGMSMLLAAVQKLTSPSFTDGSFFEYTLLSDSRFQPVAWILGGVPPEHTNANHGVVQQLMSGHLNGREINSATLLSSDQLRSLAMMMTWFTLLIEGTLAALFLVPGGGGVRVARSVLLVVFVLVTYPMAPVIGFGWILIAMAWSQLPPDARKLRVAFLSLFVILPIFDRLPAGVMGFLYEILD